MAIEIKIPAIGESITEVTLAGWHVEDGDFVEEGDILADIESDKATVELPAESSGTIKLIAEEGSDLKIGEVIASLEEGEGAPKKKEEPKEESAPAQASESSQDSGKTVQHASPAASKILAEKGMSADDIKGTGKDGRVTKADALAAESAPKKEEKKEKAKEAAPVQLSGGVSREVRREKMSRLRKTIAKKLTAAKNETAMLTTFNEVDMQPIMDLRKKYQDMFVKKHGYKLGMMSFFTKACTMALAKVPGVNAQIDGEEIVYHDYADVGIAVSSDRGLVVPVLRNAEHMSLAQIEAEIIRLATKARDGKITIDEMSGGTFTITNGGIFGSMLSTPILNSPQSAILGMHNIVQRPWVVDGEIKVRPIMYLALSYDHRIIDGKESVTFLKTVKEYLEDPARMLIEI
ncbi:MAG: dihydrolipoyllysine-residue succinyltransferase [Halobacteriovoraceae bacterium]|nr:dihydrolipoyllysine-residue succinyltransferase [Halobacteriovoraceae bacterium]|tara:strand:- start:120975 stop:122189 length:1215 start_codon:yes stop_codon:yes gene_type:complete